MLNKLLTYSAIFKCFLFKEIHHNFRCKN